MITNATLRENQELLLNQAKGCEHLIVVARNGKNIRVGNIGGSDTVDTMFMAKALQEVADNIHETVLRQIGEADFEHLYREIKAHNGKKTVMHDEQEIVKQPKKD